jgi:hypothetical protein
LSSLKNTRILYGKLNFKVIEIFTKMNRILLIQDIIKLVVVAL